MRLVSGVRGHGAHAHRAGPALRLRLAVPWVSRIDGRDAAAIAGPDMLVLRTPVAAARRGHAHGGRVRRARGRDRALRADLCAVASAAAGRSTSRQRWQRRETYWADWAAAADLDGRWREAVRALADHAQGADLSRRPAASSRRRPPRCPSSSAARATGTTAICWLRDATFTLLALHECRLRATRRVAWRDWLLRAVAGSPTQLQIMYGLAGERRLTEWEVPWLPGYEDSAPVRIGNAARAAAAARRLRRGDGRAATRRARGGLADSDRACGAAARAVSSISRSIWHEPDEGIWEVRGAPQHFTYSKVMAWVAFDRAVKSAEDSDCKRPLERWRERARRDPRRGLRRRLRSRARNASCSPMARTTRREPAADADRRLPAAGDPRMHRHGRGDRAAPDASTASCCATTRQRRSTDCRRARARSSPAASGWPTIYVLQGRRDEARGAVRAAAGAAQRCRPAGGRIRPAGRAACSAISRRRFRTWRWSTPRVSLLHAMEAEEDALGLTKGKQRRELPRERTDDRHIQLPDVDPV